MIVLLSSVMAIPATVVYFTAYDQLKYRMGYREDDPSTKHIPLLAGSSARSKCLEYCEVLS